MTADRSGNGAPRRPLPPVEPLASLPEARLRELCEALARARFGDDVAGEAESLAPGALDAVRQPVVHWRLRRDGTPAALATLLFLYSGGVARSAARPAAPTSSTRRAS